MRDPAETMRSEYYVRMRAFFVSRRACLTTQAAPAAPAASANNPSCLRSDGLFAKEGKRAEKREIIRVNGLFENTRDMFDNISFFHNFSYCWWLLDL